MTRKLLPISRSNMIDNVGEARHGQVGAGNEVVVAATSAGRTVAAAWGRAGRGRAACRRNAHDGVAVERPARERRHGRAQKPAAGSSVGDRQSAASRFDARLRLAPSPRAFPRIYGRCRVGQLIERRFGRSYSESQVWRILVSLGFSCQRPSVRALERDEGAIKRWKQTRWPALKKSAAKQRRIVVFIDESGLSERPTRVRTWAPNGETPILQHHFNWHQLSVIAGISFRRFYFRLFPGAIKGAQIIEFLHGLGQQIRQPLLVIWDGLPAHRSALVRDYLEALNRAIQIEQLPAYAPELNPTAYIWDHLKHHELGKRCAADFRDLKSGARNRMRSMQRRPTLIRAFSRQAELQF